MHDENEEPATMDDAWRPAEKANAAARERPEEFAAPADKLDETVTVRGPLRTKTHGEWETET